jgi:hypothetical protein
VEGAVEPHTSSWWSRTSPRRSRAASLAALDIVVMPVPGPGPPQPEDIPRLAAAPRPAAGVSIVSAAPSARIRRWSVLTGSAKVEVHRVAGGRARERARPRLLHDVL